MVVVNSLGSREDSYAQLLHAPWNGWTLADTIFPSFLFIIGVSLTLSTAARMEGGVDRASLVAHALRRALLIFAAGVFIDTLEFPYRLFPYFTFRDHLQLTGVLQKIAICYLPAFFLFLWTGWWGVLAGIFGLNILYLGLLYLYPVPGCGAGILTAECSFTSFVNNLLLDGHTSGAVYDPEGLGTVLPAITSVLFGVLAGGILRAEPSHDRRIQILLGSGLGLIALGTLLSSWIPFNKQLWTPSYAVFMAGLSATFFAACYWAIDVRQWGRWFKPLEIFGLNAIATYLASRPVDHALRVHVFGVSVPEILERVASPPRASLLFAVVVLVALYVGAWFMFRRRWFLKF
jgi:predicted acyltransferase